MFPARMRAGPLVRSLMPSAPRASRSIFTPSLWWTSRHFPTAIGVRSPNSCSGTTARRLPVSLSMWSARSLAACSSWGVGLAGMTIAWVSGASAFPPIVMTHCPGASAPLATSATKTKRSNPVGSILISVLLPASGGRTERSTETTHPAPPHPAAADTRATAPGCRAATGSPVSSLCKDSSCQATR